MLHKGKGFEWKTYYECFDAGYVIGKYIPELSDAVHQLERDKDFRHDALKDGIEEWEFEKEMNSNSHLYVENKEHQQPGLTQQVVPKDSKQRLPAWLQLDRFFPTSKDHNVDNEKEKITDVEIEPDI